MVHLFVLGTVHAGLAIGHPAIIYDNATDLYWMASNMNRDSTRRWRQPWQPTLPKLHITPFSKCEVRPPGFSGFGDCCRRLSGLAFPHRRLLPGTPVSAAGL